MESFADWIVYLRDIFWSGPLLWALILCGLYQTISLRGIQFRYIGHAASLLCKPFDASDKKVKGDISSFQSLMTALAGAIGTGNITGIAAAVACGGFGALFWMWIIALLGMATAYSEAILAVKYRTENKSGQMAGGPMYTLLLGLRSRRLAAVFALCGAIAACGIGAMVQSNSVAQAIQAVFPVSTLCSGIVLSVLTAAVILGGISSIGGVASILVPFMAVSYVAASIWVLGVHSDRLWPALEMIVRSAFTGQAATGAFIGSSVIMAVRMGVSKGVFSNEAGLGSLAIAASTACTSQPARQGMLAICGVWISTMIICTLTGLVLAVTQVLGQTVGGEVLSGSQMALVAFGSIYPALRYVVLVGLILFAFTTVLAWAYYGEKCIEFLLGNKAIYVYRWLYIVLLVVGAVLHLDLVWALADIANGLMALPNLFAIVALSPVVKQETLNYLRHLDVRESSV